MFGLKAFKVILKIPTLIFVVAFVVLNQQDTTLYFSPISAPLELPLWALGIVLFAFGFCVGALLLWLNSWGIYRDLRQKKKEVQELEKERNDLLVAQHHSGAEMSQLETSEHISGK